MHKAPEDGGYNAEARRTNVQNILVTYIYL
jgi:hypothetical protein